jgi:hypothetical protein
MLQAIDIQTGRIRYDLTERLNRSKHAFRREVLDKLEATINGIATAIANGVQQKSRSEQELHQRQLDLLRESSKLDAIRNELLRIRDLIHNQSGADQAGT